MWYFCGIREVAIRRLSQKNAFWTITSLEKIVLARAYKVPLWLTQGLRELAEKNTLVTRQDAKTIGFENAFVLVHICFGVEKWNRKGVYSDWVQERVATEFNAEFQELTQGAGAYTANVDSPPPAV